MKMNEKRIFMKDDRFIIILLALVFSMGVSGFAFARGASQLVAEGNAAFREGSLAEAAAHYEDAREEDPDSFIPLFNLGVVLYEQGNFPAALTAFQNIETVNDEFAQLLHYNQGNALARIGEMEESENPREALEYYLKSVAAYKRVLSIDPGHMESAYNIEVVRTWIRDLVERMEETSGTGSSSRSSPAGQNEQKSETSPGGQNERQKDGQQEQNNGGDTLTPQPPAIPSVPQDDTAVPRDETAQAILREEQLRREAEARIRGGSSADERPTW